MICDCNDDTSKDLMSFCMQLVHHSQWKLQTGFFSGSRAEIPIYWDIVKLFNLNEDKLDIDRMIYNTSRYAVPRFVSLPERYTDDIIRIYTDDVHTGYARLIREKDNKELTLSDFYTVYTDEMRHGPAVMLDYRSSIANYKFSLSDVTTDVARCKIYVGSYDQVFAVHCPYWPIEAAEWITRRRSHSFPSRSVIKRVLRYGCDFVQVSHNRLNDEYEWRFSFSQAELLITENWSISQRIVYETLWVLNKRTTNSNLCTYYFKTFMFWACEEKPVQFWNDDSLVQSVCELLIDMMRWVKSKILVNYFIPGNNMMDHLNDTDLSYDVDTLWRTSQSREYITEVIDTCRREEFKPANTTYHIESLAWIKRAFAIYQRIANENGNYKDLFSTDLTTDLQNALYVELSDINRGLYFQQKIFGCENELDKHTYFLKSECHLLLAANLHKLQERDVTDNCSQQFRQSMTKCFLSRSIKVFSKARNANIELNTKRRSTAQRQNLLKDHTEHKYLLYDRSVKKQENKRVYNYWSERIRDGWNGIIVLYRIMEAELETQTNSDAESFKEWPGRSPTVNISWFIANAYLANLYFTVQRNVSLTKKTCDDIIDVYRQSYLNEEFAESVFPVVLSTQWTNIYDEEIQELLGFYSLCSHAFDRSSRSVYVAVCPVLFAFYLKVRVVLYHMSNHYTMRDGVFAQYIKDYDEHIRQYNAHQDKCYRNKVINGVGLLTLIKALELSSRKTKTFLRKQDVDRN